VPSNTQLNIGKRGYVSEKNRVLFNPNFSNITDKYIKVSLELQRVFGLRREESLKIKPHLADKKDCLQLQPSWCKGGCGRNVPIRTDEQRYWLNQAKEIAGFDSPINGGPTSKQLSPVQKKLDHQARMVITELLGHSRKSNN